MKENKKTNLIRLGILGGVLVIVILVLGTLWMGRSASEDSKSAVRKVSLLFMDELTGRREQVVASTLADYVSDLDMAVGLMEKDDLASVENLQRYQTRMKQLYGLEKFAFVDEDGLIYTSLGTREDIALYHFDYNTINSTEISLKNLDGEDKKVVIAMPVDRLPLEDKHLVVCFMEIDMDYLLENISLEADNNNSTFCNIYTRDGETLTNLVLGGLADGDNVIDELQEAHFESGYSFELFKKQFSEGKKGAVSFTYNGVMETLCFVPIHNTDWMLTYLVREQVISDHIGTVSEGIIRRSLGLSVFAAVVLTAIFCAIIWQSRRAAALTLKRETAEAEERVRREELEEQLALQEELLDQEKQRAKQDEMITALSSDYRSVYYVNLDTDECICYRNDDKEDKIGQGSRFTYSVEFEKYAKECITEDYRQAFLDFISPENIRKNLESNVIISCRYLVKRNGEERYEMLRMAGVRHIADRTDHWVHAVGAGFSDIDNEMREDMAKSQALSDALKTAEEASKAKTVFLSNMSHEIRTPMNAIIGLNSLALNETDVPPHTREYLEKIGSSAQHLLSLINDILDMSRIESGRMTINQGEFSFSKLLEQINTIFSGQCAEKGLEYNCRVNGHVDEYYIGDSMKLRQVLINILGNAVKFTNAGGKVELLVEKTASYGGKSTLQFSIKDTGIGMSKEYLPKIFETFSQEDSTYSNKYGSSGLGMSITKSIVDMMNGSIDVVSEKGVGTEFTVTVTLMDSGRKGGDEDEFEIRPQEMSVLVIDDDPVACEHAKLVLGKVGIASETALSGKEALEMIRLRSARREPYHLIIVDWKMPEMDGVETTRAIRGEIGEETAIIILTAYNWDDVLEEALEAGVDSFIAKPLFSGNLLEEFKLALKKRKKPAGKEKAQLEGRRILLAEDMMINAQIMMEVLKMRSMEVEHAENGKLAVEMFAAHEAGYYDAILMDMRMPEMDGLTATAKIRAMDREDAKTIPIIALTANAFDEDVQRSLQAGLDAHLSKPVEPQVLFETLETML